MMCYFCISDSTMSTVVTQMFAELDWLVIFQVLYYMLCKQGQDIVYVCFLTFKNAVNNGLYLMGLL